MQEYEFVRIPAVRTRAGSGFDVDYRDVIRAHAADGWVFVQALTIEAAAHPHLDLVFTRKVAK